MLITDHFGQDAVKELMAEIKKIDYLDGKDLIDTINQTFDTNLEQLLEDFYFPETSMKTQMLTKACIVNENIEPARGLFVKDVSDEGLAGKAGILHKDVITELNGKAIKNNLDFELALYDALKINSAKLTIWRKDVGYISVELPLRK